MRFPGAHNPRRGGSSCSPQFTQPGTAGSLGCSCLGGLSFVQLPAPQCWTHQQIKATVSLWGCDSQITNAVVRTEGAPRWIHLAPWKTFLSQAPQPKRTANLQVCQSCDWSVTSAWVPQVNLAAAILQGWMCGSLLLPEPSSGWAQLSSVWASQLSVSPAQLSELPSSTSPIELEPADLAEIDFHLGQACFPASCRNAHSRGVCTSVCSSSFTIKEQWSVGMQTVGKPPWWVGCAGRIICTGTTEGIALSGSGRLLWLWLQVRDSSTHSWKSTILPYHSSTKGGKSII